MFMYMYTYTPRWCDMEAFGIDLFRADDDLGTPSTPNRPHALLRRPYRRTSLIRDRAPRNSPH